MTEESNFAKLQRLKQESLDWEKNQGTRGFWFTDCPDWTSQHNRQIQIDRLKGILNGSDDYRKNLPDCEH